MRTQTKHSFIQVVGKLWMGGTAAMQYKLSDHDIKNLMDDNGSTSKDEVELWLGSHSGDFSSVKDFYADIELPNGSNIVVDWTREESEALFNDCMYPEYY